MEHDFIRHKYEREKKTAIVILLSKNINWIAILLPQQR